MSLKFSLCPYPAPTKAHGRGSAGYVAGACVTCELLHRHWHFSGREKKEKAILLKCHLCFQALSFCEGVNCTMIFSRHNRMSYFYQKSVIDCHYNESQCTPMYTFETIFAFMLFLFNLTFLITVSRCLNMSNVYGA